MPTDWQFDDEPENWSQDHDEGDSYGAADDDDSPTVECKMCGCDVYEDAEQCPLCGEWLRRTSTVWDGRSPWFVLLGMAGIISVIMTMLFLI